MDIEGNSYPVIHEYKQSGYNNKITALDLNYYEWFKGFPWNVCENIKVLIMNGENKDYKVGNIPEHDETVAKLANLEVLQLRYAGVSAIPENLIRQLSKLPMLDLTGNPKLANQIDNIKSWVPANCEVIYD